jgi:hypothetical protein
MSQGDVENFTYNPLLITVLIQENNMQKLALLALLLAATHKHTSRWKPRPPPAAAITRPC